MNTMTLLSEVYQMEGFFNRIKIERMMSNYLNSCNSEQLKNNAKDRSQLLARQITDAMTLKTFQTLTFIKSVSF